MSGPFNWGQVLVIAPGYVLGFYIQSRQIDALRDAINEGFDGTEKRFDDMNQRFGDMNQRINSIAARFSDLKDFIKTEVSCLEDRIDRLEHPVVRPS